MLHSITRNDSLVDGNKRLALAGIIAFYGMSGMRLTMTNGEAYDLVMAVAAGALTDATDIGRRLAERTEPLALTGQGQRISPISASEHPTTSLCSAGG